MNPLGVQMVLGLKNHIRPTVRQKTCHAMEASSEYSHFSGVVVVIAFEDHCNFVVAQPLVRHKALRSQDILIIIFDIFAFTMFTISVCSCQDAI